MERANWFVGLPVRGAEFLARLTPPAQVRVFTPEDLHITVAFLGRVDEAHARAGFAQAAPIALRALTTELGEVKALGGKRRPSAFSALPLGARSEIEATMTALRDPICDAAGAPRETRPALAHVTFARPTRRATPAEVHAAAAWATALDLGRPQVRIDSVALFTWAADRTQGRAATRPPSVLFAIREERPLESA